MKWLILATCFATMLAVYSQSRPGMACTTTAQCGNANLCCATRSPSRNGKCTWLSPVGKRCTMADLGAGYGNMHHRYCGCIATLDCLPSSSRSSYRVCVDPNLPRAPEAGQSAGQGSQGTGANTTEVAATGNDV